jgi:ATP-dependent Clp protease ATP-binding subunit ClpX
VKPTDKPICNFCNADEDIAGILVKGISAAICPACIKMCDQQVEEEGRRSLIHPDVTPSGIVRYLNQWVVGQESAKKILAVAAYNHSKICFGQLKQKVQKSNVWLLGGSGTGKTLIAQRLAEYLDLPFVHVDATTLTEAGYVGDDVEQMLGKLIHNAQGSIEQAECGVILLDEIDKLVAMPDGGHRDIRGKGVQQALLRMIEGDIVQVEPTGKKKSSQTHTEDINTKNILFIFSGAFIGLQEQMQRKQIGIELNIAPEVKRPVTPEDLIRYGMIPELVGRVPIIAETDPLTVEQLGRILTEPKDAILKQYQVLLAADRMQLKFEPGFVERLAQKALKEKTGARGLKAAVESILLDVMYGAPDQEAGEITLTAEDVK